MKKKTCSAERELHLNNYHRSSISLCRTVLKRELIVQALLEWENSFYSSWKG